ncbi:MAG: carbohydrate porin [Gemmataceae bacterium]|nr:carbohydrate porin [Gemmataceae bacterium]
MGDNDSSHADSGKGNGPGGGRDSSTGGASSSATSANPAAVDIVTGTGALGRFLGFDKESGVRLGGAWIGDVNWLMSGGLKPGHWTGDCLTLVDLTLDSQKLFGIKGGLLGVEFLQFTGQPVNDEAGVVQGYNGLVVRPPLVRQELYELWWRQELFDKKLVVRIGKSVPTFDFNNVSRAVPVGDVSGDIPSVSGLIYTPLFVNTTLAGKIPGYYNSATGITATWIPNPNFYFSYGCYDGNRATGEQIGLHGPQFNGHYFHIWEAGGTWRIGSENKPGKFGAGVWDQTGPLTAVNGAQVQGASGAYLFGSQRLWYRRPGEDNSGVAAFYQFGTTNSNTALARQYCGAGLTGFGLAPSRPKDSLGCGLAWAWLNTDPNAGQFYFPDVPGDSTRMRTNELMFQSYYQVFVRDGAYLQPNLTYVPNPGERPGIREAWALTLRVIVLF